MPRARQKKLLFQSTDHAPDTESNLLNESERLLAALRPCRTSESPGGLLKHTAGPIPGFLIGRYRLVWAEVQEFVSRAGVWLSDSVSLACTRPEIP
jgi:hypothetical protein